MMRACNLKETSRLTLYRPEADLTLNRRRWLVLAAGILANACCGAGYAFSVFKKPLIDVLHCTDPQVTLAFSLTVVFLPLGMLASGAISQKYGPRAAIVLGGAVFGLGVFLSGFSSSLGWLYATFGAMSSLGQGASYGTCIAVAVSWFPDRRGLASGLVVSALGVGTLIIAPLAGALISRIGVLGTLNALGIGIVVVVLSASRFIVSPPKGFVAPTGQSETRVPREPHSDVEIGWRAMLARPLFWALFAMYLFGTFSGLMVISQASDIAQKMTELTAVAASFVVGLLGAANSAGRLFWGGVSDRIGRLRTLALMFAITTIVMLLLPQLAVGRIGLVVGFLLVGLCYGGYVGTFPSLCADAFGGRNLAANYALLFVAFGVAGVVGPRMGAVLHASTGDYITGFRTAATIAAIGLAIAIGLKLRGAKQH